MADHPSSAGRQAWAFSFLWMTVVMVRFAVPGDGSPGVYVWGSWRRINSVERHDLNDLLKQTWKA